MNEREIKFVMRDPKALEGALRAGGFRRLTPRTHEMNTLYDLPGGQLQRRGELLRLREFGGEWKLTHKAKGKAGRHKSRAELETNVADGTTMEQILAALGLQPTFRYEKFRSEWTDVTGHVVLDETPIGNFGEIEGPARWIDRTAKTLGISSDGYITDSYAELFRKWKREMKSAAKNMTFAEVRLARRR